MKFVLSLILIFICRLSYAQQELLVQLGHSDRVKCIDQSVSGKYILTCGNDQMIKLWQRNTGMLVRTFKGHRGMIYDAKLSLDTKNIYSCSWDDKRLLKWDILSGKIVKQYFSSASPVTNFCLSHDNKQIACITNEAVLILRCSDFGLIKKIPLKEPAFAQFTGDDKLLYIVNKEYKKEKLFVYDMTKLDLKELFASIYSPESFIILHGKALVSNYESVVCFDLLTGSKILSLQKDTFKITTSTISNQGETIAYGLENGTIILSDLSGNKRKLVKRHTGILNHLQFSEDNQFLVTACNDWTSKVYSLSSGEIVKEFRTYSEFIQDISLNGSGSNLAFASGSLQKGNHIGVWNITRGKLFPYYNSTQVYEFFNSVAFSQRNKAICASNTNGSQYWYAFPYNGNSASLSLGSVPVTCSVFTPNGKNIVSGNKTGSMIFWRPDRNKNESIEVDKSGIASLNISPDASKIAVGTYDGKLLIYGYESKSLLRTINSHDILSGYYDTNFVMAYGAVTGMSLDGSFAMKYASVMHVAFSPDNTLVAACGGSWIKIFKVESGELVKHIVQNGAGFSTIDFSADGKYLCSGGADFSVRLYEVASGKLIKSFEGHQNEVRSVLFSSNQKYIISGSFDTQIKIWDITLQKEILSYIVIEGGNDYVICNPQGYYFATKGASKVLSFRVGNEVFPFEQFDLKYNRPDIILDIISKFVYGESKDHPNVSLIKSYYAAYQKRLKRLGFTEAQLGTDFHVPTIKLNSNNLPLSTKDVSLHFEISAEDDKYELSNINVWVNDVPVYGSKGIAVTGKSYKRNCEISLSNERNKITVSCTNVKGVESYKESFDIVYEGGTQNYKTYFIGIGVSQYKDTSFNLKYSVKDVEDLAKMIRVRFAEADITLLTNKEATRSNILKVKEKLLKTGVNDKVIISLSGHGLLSTDLDFYYATYEMDFSAPEKSGLLYEDLEALLDGIPARNKLLMVDACHSGELDRSEMVLERADTTLKTDVKGIEARGAGLILNKKGMGLENSFELMQELFSDVSKGNGTIVISAAGGKEYALESALWDNGVFTYSVLNAFKDLKGDTDKNSKISVSELKNYVGIEVQSLTGGRQKPTSRKENLENDWWIW